MNTWRLEMPQELLKRSHTIESEIIIIKKIKFSREHKMAQELKSDKTVVYTHAYIASLNARDWERERTWRRRVVANAARINGRRRWQCPDRYAASLSPHHTHLNASLALSLPFPASALVSPFQSNTLRHSETWPLWSKCKLKALWSVKNNTLPNISNHFPNAYILIFN